MMMMSKKSLKALIIILVGMNVVANAMQNYRDALSKSILFFEGQRSGKLPRTQRLTWRKDSALRDGADKGVDLTGGYYDAGDNVKYNFPMAFTTTMLAWSVIEYGKFMGPDLDHALEAIQWSTDYLLKSTNVPGTVFAQVGDPFQDHNCWQRPEDMQTPRTVYVVNEKAPGSEVSAEIAAALAAASLAFKNFSPNKKYADLLLQTAFKVFDFADKYRGSYAESIGPGVCPFYCDYNGYEDELIWAAAWLHKVTGNSYYFNYTLQNLNNYKGGVTEFGWDAKNAGINVLVSKYVIDNKLENSTPFLSNADQFVCNVMPESPVKSVQYSPGGLLYKPGGCNMQHTTALSYLLVNYAESIKRSKRIIHCQNVNITTDRLIRFARRQVDYILGDNPLNLSYMVGYGKKFPQRIHHRGSSLPSITNYPKLIKCKDGTPYLITQNPNPNLLIGAVVGGPDLTDAFADSRPDSGKSEPTTYVNAPLVGLLAYYKAVTRQ